MNGSATKEPVELAYDAWWRDMTRRGDPAKRPRLTAEAFVAGWEARLPTDDELLAIIRDARFYVSEFHPQHAEEQRDQEAMLARIDAVLPALPPDPPFVVCDDPLCNREKGHEGPHDDIPF